MKKENFKYYLLLIAIIATSYNFHIKNRRLGDEALGFNKRIKFKAFLPKITENEIEKICKRNFSEFDTLKKLKIEDFIAYYFIKNHKMIGISVFCEKAVPCGSLNDLRFVIYFDEKLKIKDVNFLSKISFDDKRVLKSFGYNELIEQFKKQLILNKKNYYVVGKNVFPIKGAERVSIYFCETINEFLYLYEKNNKQ